MSRVCRHSPRAKITAWFWFSGLPSPMIGLPGSFTLYSTEPSRVSGSTPRRHEWYSFPFCSTYAILSDSGNW